MKNTIIFSVIVVILSVVTILFIQDTNNHKECENVEETQTAYVDGKTIKTTTNKHICKEKYNL